jgi:preprotein translocase subunit SecB
VESGLAYSLDSSIEFQTLGDVGVAGGSLVVTGEYQLSVIQVVAATEDEESSEEDIAKLDFTLAALFTVLPPREGDDPIADSEFAAYAATTGQFALYPYAREFVADMTGRMGLPSLHMGALKFNLHKQDIEEQAD